MAVRPPPRQGFGPACAHGPHRMGPRTVPDTACGLDGQAFPRPSPGPPRLRLERHVDQDRPAARRSGPQGAHRRRRPRKPCIGMMLHQDGSRHRWLDGQPPLNRHALSKAFCRRIGWFKPDGGLEDMMAKVTMPAMHKDGPIALPAPRERQNRPGPIAFGPDTEAPPVPAPTTLDEVRPLNLRPVVRGTREGRLWNTFVARYHYLGDKTLVGARCATPSMTATAGRSPCSTSPPPPGSSLRATASSDVGSHILAIVRRRLPADWTERYSTTPVLIETFAETPHHTSAVYRASGWIHAGTTQGSRALRPSKAVRQAPEGHLAPTPAKKLEAHAQPLESTAPYRLGRTFTRIATTGMRGAWK